jgi:ethanolamine utilization protein EutP (predicted NTPase)
MAVNFVKADTFDAESEYEASTNLYQNFRNLLIDLDEIWYMRAAGNAAEWFLSVVKIGARKAVLILRHNVIAFNPVPSHRK